MTTIAYDGRFIVTDSRLTRGNTIERDDCKKLFAKIGKYKAVATHGTQVYVDGFISNLDRGLALTPGAYGAVVITRENKVFEVDMSIGFEEQLRFDPLQPAAWGSGGSYALAAMYAGATASEAVEIAMRMDVHSGGELQVIELNP